MTRLKIPENIFKQIDVVLSLSLTPFIFFIITSTELYLKNRADLDNKLIVLVPFFVLFFIFLLIGSLLFHYQNKRYIKILLISFYITGPFFLLYSSIKQIESGKYLIISLIFILFILALRFIYKKNNLLQITKIFSFLSIILFVSQFIIIVSSFNLLEFIKKDTILSKPEINREVEKENLPNVYHIVLDEYQTDMFLLTLDDNVRKELGGFIFYPENTAVFGRTRMSLASTMSGILYDYKMSQIEYQKNGFNSENSILFELKKVGYTTQAYIQSSGFYDLQLFDTAIEHKNNADIKLGNVIYTKLFFNLWVYANLPNIISEKIIKPDYFIQIRAQNLLPEIEPIISRQSFINLINDKNALDKPNSYTFSHLILPHFPYVLKNDCSYKEGEESSPIEQASCTTKLILEFISTLKEINRYDNSLIVIHGDHGARFKINNNQLENVDSYGFYSNEWSLARSRSLLLIKPPNIKATEKFTTSNIEASLLDIAPTIINLLEIESGINFDGFDLMDEESIPTKRLKYYHFFDKKGSGEITDKMTRYIIKNKSIQLEKIINLEN